MGVRQDRQALYQSFSTEFNCRFFIALLCYLLSLDKRILISVLVVILLLAMLVSLAYGWVDLELDSDGDGLK